MISNPASEATTRLRSAVLWASSWRLRNRTVTGVVYFSESHALNSFSAFLMAYSLGLSPLVSII